MRSGHEKLCFGAEVAGQFVCIIGRILGYLVEKLDLTLD